MGRARTIHIPFVEGQREDIDRKLLPAGYLTRAKNVRLRKDGRWGVRYGDTALALTTNLSNNLRASQLVAFDDRLLALGDANFSSSVQALDAYEYVNQAQFAWAATDYDSLNVRLAQVTGVRDMGRPQSQAATVTILDCAASNGLVCMVFETSSESTVHIFRAETDATVLIDDLPITRPRVVSIGDTFFIAGISGTSIKLFSYDPSTDEALQTETDVFSAGAAIVHWDFAPNGTDDGAWAVVHRSTPTTSVKELNASGTVILTFAGPATAFNFVSICETATRVHLAVVATSDSEVDLYSYTLAGALSTGPTALNPGVTCDSQPGVCDMTVTGSTETVGVFASMVGTPGDYDVVHYDRNATTHANLGTVIYAQSRLSGKPLVKAAGAQAVNHAIGTVQSTGSFASNNLVAGLGQRAPHIAAAKDLFTAGAPALAHLPRVAKDVSTGKGYWPTFVTDKDSKQIPVVTEFSLADDSQIRQVVDIGGLLYIFGGAPQSYDTRGLVEAGYQETPVLYNVTASNGAGSLPTSTTLNLAVIWRWYDSRGFLHESQLSEIETVTMGATDDTITFSASVPHSLRCNVSSTVTGSSVEVVAFRSLSGKKQLRRCASATVGVFGDAVSFTLTGSDASIAANEIIYTQSGRGALGDVLEHEAPLPGDYACRLGKRILSAGGADPYLAQVSKPQFPGEPVNWSGEEAFLIRCPDRIRGVAAQDLNGFLFSRRAVYVFTGDGPDDTGQGSYSDPVELPSSIGLHSANSIVVTPIGVLYQADEEKIFRIPRGGGEPDWFGQAVRDTLLDFPVVTAAAVLPTEQLVTFACNNTAGTDGRLIHYDLRGKVWIVDEFDGSTPVTSIAEYQGRLARLSEGVITLANETHPAAAFIDHSLTTGPVCPDWCKLVNITLLGEFRGNCTVTCLISYDLGKTWTTLKAFALSTAGGYTAGDAVSLQWWPRRRKGDRFMMEFRVTALAGAASEGFVWNECTLGILDKKGEKRTAAGKRG